ncbi:MAG: HIT family protein [Bdellovibrionales bacterium]|nr:HIT family protein [Bdellovibrionales bacterium]
MNRECVFCKIIRRELPSHRIYEDSRSYAFLDINPINAGHTLVVPKRHVSRFSELTDSEAGHLFSVGKKILNAIEASDVICEGANLFLSDGPVAGQEVMHSHLHIAPRFENDGHKMGFSHSDPEQAKPAKMAEVADSISRALK